MKTLPQTIALEVKRPTDVDRATDAARHFAPGLGFSPLGLESRWEWDEFSELAQNPPALIARALLMKLGKIEDDATVIVARNATS